jgi:hypothetical protein
MPNDIQELKEYLENMRDQCILGKDCADLDVHDMTVLLSMIEKFENQQKEYERYGKALQEIYSTVQLPESEIDPKKAIRNIENIVNEAW